MIPQIIIAYATEGTTDMGFLKSVIKRTFEEVALEYLQELEIVDPIHISKFGGSIEEKALHYASQAVDNGATILCFHVDADDRNDETAFKYLIFPAFDAIKKEKTAVCKNLVAIVPVQMTEAWMLADKELLKRQLGTKKNDEELGINKNPEDFSDPKNIIESAIRIAREHLTKRRRRKLTISELYQPIGQTIKLNKLDTLPSYQKFKEAVRDAFKQLNYLY
ncbi:DUF4276 family protein [Floridanema evergladense]|uniref:DUF4276 family protein n=1 Tax=Floridaenema evergladense BLCC-F167 TaxID=3153639 RepID=A0ABV4WDK4_9CYAN